MLFCTVRTTGHAGRSIVHHFPIFRFDEYDVSKTSARASSRTFHSPAWMYRQKPVSWKTCLWVWFLLSFRALERDV